MKQFLLLVLSCVLCVFSNLAKSGLKSLNQLNNQLADAKTAAEQLDAKIELIDFYAQVDPRKWKTSIQDLYVSRKRYPERESHQNQALIRDKVKGMDKGIIVHSKVNQALIKVALD